MYISRLILDPRSRQVQSELANVYQLHRTIMRAFPEDLSPDERILFRLELGSGSSGLTLLVQSAGEPDWSWLGGAKGPRYLMEIQEPNPWVKPYKPVFSVGQRLYFRLRANPTVKRAGKRLGLYREEDQWAWLRRKAERGGFAVLGANITWQEQVRGARRPAGHVLCLLAVQFDGLLEVSEPERFLASIRNGLGSGKAFGCGLLSVAPA